MVVIFVNIWEVCRIRTDLAESGILEEEGV